MKILFVHHYLREKLHDFRGSIPILAQLFEKKGHNIKHIAKKEWSNFFNVYREFKPDMIITCGPIGGIIAIFKRVGLIKCKVVFHWGDNYAEIMGQKWGKNVISFLENSAVKYSDIVITISKYRLERGIKKFDKVDKKNIFYLSLGYNPKFLASAKKIKLPGKNKTKIVYAGEIAHTKNFDKIDELFNKLNNIDFIIIGSKECADEKTHPNVFYLGFKPPKEVYSYLKSSDFLLVTENNDSSLKLFEYQVFGKPIFVPRGRISKYLSLKNNIYYNDFSEIPALIKHPKKFKPQKIKTWGQISNDYLQIIQK